MRRFYVSSLVSMLRNENLIDRKSRLLLESASFVWNPKSSLGWRCPLMGYAEPL